MNTLGNLNMYLFEQLERLNKEELKGDDLKEELDRGKGINEVAKTIISNASLVLQAEKFKDDKVDIDRNVSKMLEG